MHQLTAKAPVEDSHCEYQDKHKPGNAAGITEVIPFKKIIKNIVHESRTGLMRPASGKDVGKHKSTLKAADYTHNTDEKGGRRYHRPGYRPELLRFSSSVNVCRLIKRLGYIL